MANITINKCLLQYLIPHTFWASFGSFLLCGWNFLLSNKHTHWHFVFADIRLQNVPVYSHTWIIERENEGEGGGAFCLTSVCFLEAETEGEGEAERERESGGGLGNDARSDVSILSHCLITNAHTCTLKQSISRVLKDVYSWEHCLIAALKLFILHQYFNELFQCCIRCF